MKRLLAIAASAALALGGLTLGAPSASADDRTCTGTISGGHVDGNVIIPAGATCTLSGVTVEGNVQSQGHASVTVRGSTIGGNIQLEQGGAVNLNGNVVDGDIQLFSNRSGAKDVTNNRVDGNLQCKSNTPAPTGSGNVVQGNAEDQCSNLRPAGGGGGGGAQDGTNVDIYITPGTWLKNGRTWYTSCEPFSQIQRCRVDIWSSKVDYVNGRYVRTTGRVFNNLTYTAAPRALWAGNPLAASGQYQGTAGWNSAGRQWRTECDTATTGRNGCRSYVTADVVRSSGGRYYTAKEWVFNNMVRFA